MNIPGKGMGSVAFLLAMWPSIALSADDPSDEERARAVERRAQLDEQIAEDWRNMGNETMAEYYEQSAERTRHNGFAEQCDFAEEFLSGILGSDACRTKGPSDP